MKVAVICLLMSAMLSFESQASGYGKLIEDQSINPRELPMYDDYTRYESRSTFDVDYTRFWKSNDELCGLGDFTNEVVKNSVSYEFATNVLEGAEGTGVLSRIPDVKNVNGYWVAEGRLCCALPPGAIINPDIYEPMVPEVFGNIDNYTDESYWTKGAPALSYVANIMDRRLLGMHVDCVLEDGVVLPLIVTDLKALHKGMYKGSEVCKDYLLKGYGHWRGYSDGTLSYLGVLEVGISEDYKQMFEKNKLDDLHLRNNKIVGFRCYPETCGRFYNKQ